MTTHISVVIVTYNSSKVIFQCLRHLFDLPEASSLEVIVVDGASPDSAYLEEIGRQFPAVRVVRLAENVGFSRANNAGFRASDVRSPFVLFLNPDAFVPASVLPELLGRMKAAEWNAVGVCSPLLLGYSLSEDKPTGRIDSAGIGRTWYGRYYDQGQGAFDASQLASESSPLAICGAFMFCRRSALDQVAADGAVFDECFFMYKEDIELSLRLRHAGWEMRLCPDLSVYHCRGWNAQRNRAPSWSIWHSLKNDWAVWRKGYASPAERLVHGGYLVVKSVIVGGELAARLLIRAWR